MDDKMTELHCYTNGTDTVVASDEDDGASVVAEHLGERVEDVGALHRVDDATVLKILDEETGASVAKTAAEWARSNGRGFLCSTEW